MCFFRSLGLSYVFEVPYLHNLSLPMSLRPQCQLTQSVTTNAGQGQRKGATSKTVKNRQKVPRGPQDSKIKSREGILKKSSFQYGMNFFQSRMVFSFRAPLWPQRNRVWDWNFQSRMKFSNREWKFQARMKTSCVGEWFFHAFEREWFFLSPGPLGIKNIFDTFRQFSRGTSFPAFFVKAARLQNEIAPENFLIWHEKRFEKREKGPEKRSETRPKNF